MPNLSDAMQVFTGMIAVSVLFMVACLVLVANNRTVGDGARAVFLVCIGSIALITIADWFNVVFGPTNPGLRSFHIVSMALTFALAPVFPVAIAHTVFPESSARWIVAILVLHAVFELATIFGGFVFWVDAQNVYHRGALYGVYMGVYSVSAVYLSYKSIRAGRTYQSVNIVSILMILGFLAIGVGIQIAKSNIRTTWPTVGMVLFLYFQFYAEMVLRTDALTHLLNRHSYEEFLRRPTLPCAVVLIDVDDFKHVNDTYGHAFGDECLTTIAVLIRQAFGTAGQCFRTGGDEFTVILTRRQSEARILSNQLCDLVQREQLREARLPSISFGVAKASDEPSLRGSVNEADRNMYEAKRLKKALRQ